MRIQGNLATYEFSDLLQWLAQGNKTGILTVTDGTTEYQLGFDHGRVDMSSSSDPSKRLDNYLYSKGVIDDATLARAERLRDATKMMAGQVLVTLGAVTETQLAQALRDKTEEILCELLTWDHGTFEFAGGDRPESTMVPISLEVTKLLLESMHRLDQRRSGQVAPAPASTEVPAAVEETAPETITPEVSPDATQAIDGLALAEVLDPETPSAPPSAEIDPTVEMPSADLPPHYAVMAQNPSAIRRYAPYALVVLFSLTAGAFYLANTQTSAEAVGFEAGGEPILFTQTTGPTTFRPQPAVAAVPVTEPVPAQSAAVVESNEQALRLRYEQELAGLRKELEAARRLAQPTDLERPSSPTRPAGSELPADAIMRAAVTRPTAEQETSLLGAVQPPIPAPAEPDSSRATEQVVAAAAEPPVAEPPQPEATTEPPAAETQPASVRPFELVNPKLVTRPTPSYPVAARRHGRGATLTVRVLVGVDGQVEEIERIGPKAGMGFDRAAEDAARASTWEPGTQAGVAKPMWAELRFDFKP